MTADRDTSGAPSAARWPWVITSERRAPVPETEVDPLKALALGACALVLCVTSSAATADAASDLEARLAAHTTTLRKDTSVVRFFESQPWLLRDPEVGRAARTMLSRAQQRESVARARAETTRRRLTARRAAAVRTALRKSPPRRAICAVFGPHCTEALQVAHCESRLRTSARNGQYRGLFQMGAAERRLFGHGPTAYEQARAAHRYFVRSGRDWSPWSCKPGR